MGTETSNWAQALQEAVCVYMHIACVCVGWGGGGGEYQCKAWNAGYACKFVCFFGFARGLVSVSVAGRPFKGGMVSMGFRRQVDLDVIL